VKNALSRRRLREAGEEFEEIERRMFGEHGFEDAVGQIERALGFADLARSTAPPPRQP
jgi:hypothetical protein